MKHALFACLILATAATAAATERAGPLIQAERAGHRYEFPDFFEPGVHAALIQSARNPREFQLTEIRYFQTHSKSGFGPGHTSRTFGRMRLKSREIAAIEAFLPAAASPTAKEAALVAKVMKRMRREHQNARAWPRDPEEHGIPVSEQLEFRSLMPPTTGR